MREESASTTGGEEVGVNWNSIELSEGEEGGAMLMMMERMEPTVTVRNDNMGQ